MGRGGWKQRSLNFYGISRRFGEPDWYLIAFCGILLGQIFNRPYFDLAASILIGILLFGTAALLGRESGALLVGERTRSATILKVERILRDEPSIEKVGDLLTMQLGPEQVLLTADVRFQRELNVEHLEEISKIESRIRSEEPRIRQIFFSLILWTGDRNPRETPSRSFLRPFSPQTRVSFDSHRLKQLCV
jgi:hypothetical protein